MKKTIITLMTMIFCPAVIALPAFAQDSSMKISTLTMGTGAPTGNYLPMANDIKSYCSNALENANIKVMSSGGAMDNLAGISNKQFVMGITQEDVLRYLAQNDPQRYNENRLKIVAGLHTEAAHLLVPNTFDPSNHEKGFWGEVLSQIGIDDDDDTPKGISLELLKNHQVASWGGGVVSAKALSYFLGLNLQVYEVPPEKQGTDLGMPILLMGGQPFKPVEKYLETGKYTLVPIDYNLIKSNPKAKFYLPATLNYKVNGEMKTIPTFAVRAYLMGKSFRKESRNQNMMRLAMCIEDNLADLADDPDTNPNWASVYELRDEQTNWSYFPLPQEPQKPTEPTEMP